MDWWVDRRLLLSGARVVAFVLLGLLLPASLLWSAKQAIDRLDPVVTTSRDLAEMAQGLPERARAMEHGNDYALLFGALVETGNQRAAVNRMNMKIAVMHIGFAIACVGLLLIALGIDAGGVEVNTGFGETATVNVKVASSGVAVFVLGAVMAGGGGLLPMEHRASTATFALGPLSPRGLSDSLISALTEELKRCDEMDRTSYWRANCRAAVLASFRTPGMPEAR